MFDSSLVDTNVLYVQLAYFSTIQFSMCRSKEKLIALVTDYLFVSSMAALEKLKAEKPEVRLFVHVFVCTHTHTSPHITSPYIIVFGSKHHSCLFCTILYSYVCYGFIIRRILCLMLCGCLQLRGWSQAHKGQRYRASYNQATMQFCVYFIRTFI